MPILTMLVLCAIFAPIGAQDPDILAPRLVAPSTENNATPTLVPDANAIVPGKPFTLAIHFKIENGWHLYHPSEDNPGMEPVVVWTLPDGFKAGKLQFPPSQRNETSAGVEHVYEDELVLLVDFKVDENVAVDQTISIEAKLKWLCCRDDQCKPEKADLKIDLPTAASSSPNRSEDFLRWREAVRANHEANSDH